MGGVNTEQSYCVTWLFLTCVRKPFPAMISLVVLTCVRKLVNLQLFLSHHRWQLALVELLSHTPELIGSCLYHPRSPGRPRECRSNLEKMKSFMLTLESWCIPVVVDVVLLWSTIFFMLVLLRRTSLWSPSMIYISINGAHIYFTDYISIYGPLRAAFMFCINSSVLWHVVDTPSCCISISKHKQAPFGHYLYL